MLAVIHQQHVAISGITPEHRDAHPALIPHFRIDGEPVVTPQTLENNVGVASHIRRIAGDAGHVADADHNLVCRTVSGQVFVTDRDPVVRRAALNDDRRTADHGVLDIVVSER